MTNEKMKQFEQFLLESFENDITIRELRLSEEELSYLKKFFPRAIVRIMPYEVCEDGKRWYEVSPK
jgi:hypothetical protein